MTEKQPEKSQLQALELLKEAKANGTLDKAIEAELAGLICVRARLKFEKNFKADSTGPAMENKEIEDTDTKKLELKKQYERHISDISVRGKNDTTKYPSFEEAISTFKPEDLEIAIHCFPRPIIGLYPIRISEQLVGWRPLIRGGLDKVCGSELAIGGGALGVH